MARTMFFNTLTLGWAELAELAVLAAEKNLTAIVITSLAGKPHGQGLSPRNTTDY